MLGKISSFKEKGSGFEIRSNQYTTDLPCGRQCEVRGAAEDCLPRTLEVQDERETTVGEEQRGTVPRGGVVPCAL